MATTNARSFMSHSPLGSSAPARARAPSFSFLIHGSGKWFQFFGRDRPGKVGGGWVRCRAGKAQGKRRFRREGGQMPEEIRAARTGGRRIVPVSSLRRPEGVQPANSDRSTAVAGIFTCLGDREARDRAPGSRGEGRKGRPPARKRTRAARRGRCQGLNRRPRPAPAPSVPGLPA